MRKLQSVHGNEAQLFQDVCLVFAHHRDRCSVIQVLVWVFLSRIYIQWESFKEILQMPFTPIPSFLNCRAQPWTWCCRNGKLLVLASISHCCCVFALTVPGTAVVNHCTCFTCLLFPPLRLSSGVGSWNSDPLIWHNCLFSVFSLHPCKSVLNLMCYSDIKSLCCMCLSL